MGSCGSQPAKAPAKTSQQGPPKAPATTTAARTPPAPAPPVQKEEAPPVEPVEAAPEPERNVMEEEFKAPLDIKPWIARQATLELEMQVKLLEEEKRMQNVRITKLMKAMQEKQEQSNHERENARDVKKFSTAEREKMMEVFTRFDTDSSGAIDKHEFVEMVHELGVTLSPQDAEEAIKFIGGGKTDIVDFESFASWWNSDNTQRGKKGVALALARSKLRSLAVASGKGAAERLERDHASVKGGVGVPVDTDITVHLGSMEVPRTHVKVSMSNYSEAEFVKIADTRFSEVERPTLENPEIFDKESVQANQGPILFSEFTIDLQRPCPNEEQEKKFLRNLEKSLANLCTMVSNEIAPGWLWGSVDCSDLPAVTIKLALAYASAEKKIVTALSGSPDPDTDDLEKLISQLEFELNLGINLDEFLRSMLEQSIAAIHIADEGLQAKLKGRLAPAGLAAIVPILNGSLFSVGGSGRKVSQDKKLFEMLMTNIQGLETDIHLGNPLQILDEASDQFVEKLREAVPEERRVPGFDEELQTLRMALVFLSTLIVEKRITISNTPLNELLTSLVNMDSAKAESLGWDSNDMSPVDVLYSMATFIKEVKSVNIWTKYQMVSMDADGLALFALLPCNKAEIAHYMTKRRVSRKLQSDFASVQYAKFPILKGEIDFAEATHATRFIWESLESVLDAVSELEGEQLRIQTPGG